jgi:hypothetical protein
LEAVIVTHSRRAVELMAWRESSEVAAYYHEGLIHLSGLFASGLCRFEGGRLQVSLQPERIEALMAWYRQTWLLLTECYLLKQDARTFLDRFVDPERWPIQEAARVFAEHYWARYRAIGQRVKEKEVDAG